MSDDANPYKGIADCASQWASESQTTLLTVESLWGLFEALRDEQKQRPDLYLGWCSRCKVTGFTTVMGDQAEWHGCKPKP